MKRRTVLATVAGIAGAGAAGCLSSDGNSPGGGDETTTDDPTTPGDDPTTTPGDDPTTTPRGTPDPADWNPQSGSAFDAVTVGSREGVPFPDNNKPISVWVWNAADSERTIGITVRETTDAFVFEHEVQLPADGWTRMTLNEPAAYELVVEVDGERTGAVTLDSGTFDCNDSVTKVAVGPDGSVDSVTESTLVACGGPAVNGQSFDRGPSDCGSRDEATVEFRDEAVHVSGAVRTPNPCMDLTLSSAALESGEGPEDARLALTVATDGQLEDMCVDCVGTVDYETTVELRNDYPRTVRVVHESMDESRTVAEVDRGPGTP